MIRRCGASRPAWAVFAWPPSCVSRRLTGQVPAVAWRALHRRLLRIAFRDAIEVGDLAIDGDDLRRLGVQPGPLLGQSLHELLEAVLRDPSCNTVAHLSAMVRARVDAGSAQGQSR